MWHFLRWTDLAMLYAVVSKRTSIQRQHGLREISSSMIYAASRRRARRKPIRESADLHQSRGGKVNVLRNHIPQGDRRLAGESQGHLPCIACQESSRRVHSDSGRFAWRVYAGWVLPRMSALSSPFRWRRISLSRTVFFRLLLSPCVYVWAGVRQPSCVWPRLADEASRP